VGCVAPFCVMSVDVSLSRGSQSADARRGEAVTGQRYVAPAAQHEPATLTQT
jgi:hypothetical protein